MLLLKGSIGLLQGDPKSLTLRLTSQPALRFARQAALFQETIAKHSFCDG
jgi:hypothetical protein